MCGNEPTKWFHCKPQTGEPAAYAIQGIIYLGYWLDFTLDSGGRIWLEISGEVEFCTPFDPADSLAAQPDRELVRACSVYAPNVDSGDGKLDDDGLLLEAPSQTEKPPGPADGLCSRRLSRPVVVGQTAILPPGGPPGVVVSRR